MIEWFRSLPKAMFVAVVLTAGVLFIVLSDPPRTVCDSQVENFKASTKDLLFSSTGKGGIRPARIGKLTETCKTTNSTGGCYELFAELKRLIRDAQTVSPECYPKLSSLGELKNAIWGTLDLMAKIAWGSSPPKSIYERTGWFDSSDLNLFCGLKRLAINIYSEGEWQNFTAAYLASATGAKDLGREEAWNRTLYSIDCSAYL